MKKHIYDEGNGLSYTLHGDYYLPDLAVNEEEPTYGKYGMLRKQFLKEHKPARYQYLLMTGELTGHLNQVDRDAREQVETLVKQMVGKQGVTEQLKMQDLMKWVGLMNNIKASPFYAICIKHFFIPQNFTYKLPNLLLKFIWFCR